MILRLLSLLVAGVAAWLCGTANAADRVVFVRVEGTIGEDTVAMIGRAIDVAEDDSVAHLVLEIDSPGGAVLAMNEIGRRLEHSKIAPVAWVRGDALSAAAFVALCGERIYMRSSSQIGSATPIFALPGLGAVPTDQIDETIHEKMISDVRTRFRAKAAQHDRPGLEALAEAMVDATTEVLWVQYSTGGASEERAMTRVEYDDLVRDGTPARILKTISPAGRLLNLVAADAFEYGVTDGIVESREELLGALGAPGAEISEITVSWSESFFGALGNYAWILWAVAIGLLYLEMKTPGFGLMGTLGIGLVALLLFRNHMIGLAELPEILLVVLGVVLLAVEVFVIPGFGVTGIVGIVAIGLGVVLSFLPFFMPSSASESDLLHLTIRNFVLSVLLGPLGAYLCFHFVLRRTPLYRSFATLGPEAVEVAGSAVSLTPDHAPAGIRTGDRGTAVSVLRPAGKVEVDGKLLDAVTGGEYVEQGTRIEIIAVAANHVVVRAAPAES